MDASKHTPWGVFKHQNGHLANLTRDWPRFSANPSDSQPILRIPVSAAFAVCCFLLSAAFLLLLAVLLLLFLLSAAAAAADDDDDDDGWMSFPKKENPTL